MVLFVSAGKSSAYNDACFTIGIEIKEHLFDLQRDWKIKKYMGKTDYTFLAVEDPLLNDALIKADSIPGLGVFSLTTGSIIKQPLRQNVPVGLHNQFLNRALFHPNPPFTFYIENLDFFCPSSPPCREDLQRNLGKPTTLTNNLNTPIIMNFVGNRKPEARIPRFELKNGKLTLWKGTEQPVEEYDYAEGCLLGIDIRRRDTRNGEMVYCDFHMKNGEDLFDISTIASSGVTADLVSRLKNVQDPGNSVIRIDAWQNNKYTNVFMKENGRPVVRAALPRVVKIDRGFKVESDSSERDSAVMRIIEEINAKIQNKGDIA